MSTLHFAVWASAAEVALGNPEQVESLTVSGTSASASAITGSSKRKRVRIFTDAKIWVTFGLTPTAKTDGTEGFPMAAEATEYFDIEAGHKIAAITRV